MSITIGAWEFNNVDYDAEADVLYLSIGEPRPALGEETPEGHILLFDIETGEFCGVTLVSIGHLMDLHGDDLTITVPRRERIIAADLAPAMA